MENFDFEFAPGTPSRHPELELLLENFNLDLNLEPPPHPQNSNF